MQTAQELASGRVGGTDGPAAPVRRGGVEVWTPATVEARLRKAAQVLTALPGGRDRPSGRMVAASPARDVDMALIDQVELRQRLQRWLPSPREIAEMDAALTWRDHVAPGDWDMVLARAAGVRWEAIARRDGRSVRTLQRAYGPALRSIAIALNATR